MRYYLYRTDALWNVEAFQEDLGKGPLDEEEKESR